MIFKFMSKSLVIALFSSSLCAAQVRAENEVLPALPAPIQGLVDQGAQIRFLGKDMGVEGWVAIKNGQEQYFYVLPGQGGFISGLLFDEKGNAITLQQVKNLREQNGIETLDVLASDSSDQIGESKDKDKYEFKTPSEQMFWDIEHSNWLPIGKAGLPVFYAFIDPQCPHCHAMMEDLRDKYIKSDLAQIRIVPVGRNEESKAQAAFLLAAPDPEDLWWRHMDGDETALPAKRELSQQGVERNLAIMQTWKFTATPMVVYRGKDGKVKIVRGRPKDLEALVNDIGARS